MNGRNQGFGVSFAPLLRQSFQGFQQQTIPVWLQPQDRYRMISLYPEGVQSVMGKKVCLKVFPQIQLCLNQGLSLRDRRVVSAGLLQQ